MILLRNLKRRLAVLLAALVATGAVSGFAAEPDGPAATAVRVTVNGEFINAPVIAAAGHELLPVRVLAEALGAGVDWDAASRTVKVTRDGQTSLLPVGGAQANVGLRHVSLPVPTMIYGGRAYAAVEFFAEALARVDERGSVIALRGFEHPLDPLTGDEIATAVAVFKKAGLASDSSRFVQISLNEPPKAEVLAWQPGDKLRREAFAIIYDRPDKVTEAVADVVGKRVVSSRAVKDVQPQVLYEEYDTVPDMIKADPGWQAAMQKRGITDFDQVQFDVWAGGYYAIPEEEGHRVLRAVSYLVGDATNLYARPIEGVVVYVDPNLKRVLKVVDTGVVPISGDPANLDDKSVGPLRTPPEPLAAAQPQGVSFKVRGHEIEWQNWHFRWTVHPRNGLILYDVGYADGGRVRPVMYSAALSEMMVPYAEADQTFFWRNAFDVGEYGLGKAAHTLEPGQQCPANAAFFDVAMADEEGAPYVQAQAVCVFERDGDVAWSHFESSNGNTQSRRGTDLVIRFMTVVGNYDYGINWVFHQDGSIDQETDATGIVEPKGVDGRTLDGVKPEQLDHATLVAPFVAAPFHQHFFNYRLDMDVDGTRNMVMEMETVPAPAKQNPYGNAWNVVSKLLGTEAAAQRDVNPSANRMWEVASSNRKNSLGYNTGYLLMPGETAVPYSDPSTIVRQRSGFVNHQLWVTPYRADEQYAAGDYPNQSRGGDGLPAWTAGNRSVADQDLVLWYTMGLTHVPRPEDWPVMPTHRLGFKLLPVGFFDRNPALDLPEEG